MSTTANSHDLVDSIARDADAWSEYMQSIYYPRPGSTGYGLTTAEALARIEQQPSRGGRYSQPAAQAA